MSKGKNNPQKIKYNLFINILTNVLSSNTNANNAIIKDTKDKSHTQIKNEKINNNILSNPNHGNLPIKSNKIIPQNNQTIKILIKFLKNH